MDQSIFLAFCLIYIIQLIYNVLKSYQHIAKIDI